MTICSTSRYLRRFRRISLADCSPMAFDYVAPFFFFDPASLAAACICCAKYSSLKNGSVGTFMTSRILPLNWVLRRNSTAVDPSSLLPSGMTYTLSTFEENVTRFVSSLQLSPSLLPGDGLLAPDLSSSAGGASSAKSTLAKSAVYWALYVKRALRALVTAVACWIVEL